MCYIVAEEMTSLSLRSKNPNNFRYQIERKIDALDVHKYDAETTYLLHYSHQTCRISQLQYTIRNYPIF
jgi:hypothetical protein